jgi:hypothetical protein
MGFLKGIRMKKISLSSFGVALFFCAVILVLGLNITPEARAAGDGDFVRTPILGFNAVPGEVNLAINRDSVENQLSSGEANTLLAQYTLTNRGSQDIKVSSPRLYALANGSFSLGRNVANMRLSDYGDIQREGHINGNTVEFPGWFTVPANSALRIYIAGDILSSASVEALEFEPDFTSPTFIINYEDKMGNDVALAPFNLVGNVTTLHLNGQNYMTNVDTASNVDYARHYYDVQGTLTAPYFQDGAIIRNEAGIDVYIIKYNNGKRFMRLILSPSVFRSYQHLKWENILVTNDVVMKSYSVSSYVYVSGDSTIWRLEPLGDTGIKRRFLTTNTSAWTDYDPDGVYEINTVDRDSYSTGSNILN